MQAAIFAYLQHILTGKLLYLMDDLGTKLKMTNLKQTNFIKLFLLSIFIIGIPSCEEDCICCDLKGPYHFDAKIVNFEVEGIDKQVAPSFWEPYRQGDTVNATGELAIHLKSFIQQIAFQKNSIKGGLFMNSAYACSPVNEPRIVQEFVSLRITSTEDYDVNYPAGSDLIDLFVAIGEQDSVNKQKIPLAQHLATNFDYFILRAPWLFLNKNPDSISTHIFKFELVLSDTTFNFQTPEIILK